MELFNGDCLEVMKDISNNSIDLLFCDLPYGQTSCKWDCLIDLDLFWKQVNRICKDDSAMFFTCSTKFGVSLINSNPKNFRYDLVWVKSSACGFLNAKKMPMKKHEMVYVFYKKLPKVYGECLAEHHTHKFIKSTDKEEIGGLYRNKIERIEGQKGQYDPPLPTSVIRDTTNYKNESDMYGKVVRTDCMRKNNESMYEPPLPTSVIGEKSQISTFKKGGVNNLYGDMEGGTIGNVHGSNYEPPLPTSVIRNDDYDKREIKERNTIKQEEGYGKEYLKNKQNFRAYNPKLGAKGEDGYLYDPPLPNSILEVKSEKGKHATQKPVDLIKWCLKYYSKEGDVVLDPTMGSGSTGVACKEMNRDFIGIEMDETIFKIAEERLK